MRHITTLLCALMMLTGMLAMAETHTIVAADYSVRADAANHAIFYSLTEANYGKSFNFYIYIAEDRHDIEWGKTYTMDDMNSYYCYWQEDAVTAYSIVEASFTKTKGEGYATNFTAHVLDSEGEEFDISYTEDPLILTSDTVRVTFEKPAWIEHNTDGTWQIEAGNDTISGRVQYYSNDEESCAGTFEGNDIYLISCYMNVFTGEYEYGVPIYERVFAKDASAQVTEDEKRIDAHAVLVGEDGVVYDMTMAFVKPEVEDHVTITSDSLLIETWGYDMFGTIQMSASDDKHKVIFWFEPYGLDSLIAGTYTVGERQLDGWVINLETGAESSLYSGSIIVAYDDEAYSVEGAFLCKNGVEYTLHLSIAKPGPTREETIVFARIPMTIDQDGWGAYGESADHTKFISICSPSTTVAGTYTEEDLIADYCFVTTNIAADGSTNQYFTMKEANLTATFNTTDSVAHITGTMFCFNTQNPNDRPVFTIDVTTAMSTPFFEDDTEAFSAEFATYEINDLMVEDVGSVLVEARNDEDGAFVALQLFVAEGATTLSAGTFPISYSEAPQTALASRGQYATYATYSIAGFANENNEYSRIWFLVSGDVTIRENGTILVEALNSNGKAVHCTLYNRAEGIEDVTKEKESVKGQKRLEEGILFIEHNGRIYNAQGAQIK